MKKTNKLPELIAATALLFAGCSNDEVVKVYQGEAISFNTQVLTRATSTTLDNLNAFKVYADAKDYPVMFIDGVVATKDTEGEKGHYNLLKSDGSNFFWPTDVNTIRFWAYGPAGNTDTKADFEIGSTTINASTQELKDIQPKADLKEGGKAHKDLVLAYSEVQRSVATGMRVKLDFKHALSQINIKAKNGSHDKLIYIKGAWLMGVYGKGTLTFKEEETATAPNVHSGWMLWQPNTPTNYGITKDGTVTDNSNPLLLGQNTVLMGTDNSSNLMLVPQKRDAYKFSDDKNPTPTEGAYIMLLCRVVAEHPGASHGETTALEATNKHYHQLFPVNEKGDFKDEEFGYTCVPIAVDWIPGRNYTYNLTFCGTNSGAGVYPPTLPDDFKPFEGDNSVTIIDKPSGKKPGEPVLDQPITFEVTIDKWVDETDKDVDMK